MDGGTPDLYVPVQDIRCEVRCYGASNREASEVWRALVEIVRDTVRQEVAVRDGTALIHFMEVATGPNQMYDEDIETPFILMFIRAFVDERALA